MKNAFLFLIIIKLSCLSNNCQTTLLPDSTIISGSGEKIRLFTDRSLYCVNESIFFTAAYSCETEGDSVIWSRVLYVELIKWNGVKIAGLKLKLDASGTTGILRIPGDLLSGNYYLRAYTKWMRNFSVNDYGYLPVKIVNPFNGEIDAGPAVYSQNSQMNLIPSKESFQGIQCLMNKNQYKQGEKAQLEIFDSTGILENVCISIAKAGSIDTSFISIQHEWEPSKIKWGDIEYLPEITGMTISGKMVSAQANAPAGSHLVSLSEIANGEYFSFYHIRDNGRFLFSLPDLYGKHEFYIQSEASDAVSLNFLVDNDFCMRPVSLPYVAFRLNEDEKLLVQEMTVNMQLNEKFLPELYKKPGTATQQPTAFYGSPYETFYTQKYIELPNIEEFIIEIVRGATVVYNKGKAELKMSANTGFINYPPLIFLDNIMVNNVDKLLKIPLVRIERVEVISGGYSSGDMKYSGLLSIYSKNKDFAGMEQNKNSMFFAYDMFSEINSDTTSNENPYTSRIPDRRNVLYWNPDIHISAGERGKISFYTSESKGDYVVYIFRKNTGNERTVYGKCFFSVK